MAVITKCDRKLLQRAAGITNCKRKLLESVTGITKLRKSYFKVRQVLQSVTVITR